MEIKELITIKTKIGNQEITVSLPDMKAVHKFNSVYSGLPGKCDNCGSGNIYLSFKNPGGNDYYMMACGDCRAEANFGILKDGKNTLFWKRSRMEVWQGDSQQQPQQPQPGPSHLPAGDEDDLPF